MMMSNEKNKRDSQARSNWLNQPRAMIIAAIITVIGGIGLTDSNNNGQANYIEFSCVFFSCNTISEDEADSTPTPANLQDNTARTVRELGPWFPVDGVGQDVIIETGQGWIHADFWRPNGEKW